MSPSSSDLTRLSACEMSQLIQTRKISPTEVLDAHLSNIARVNPQLNAIVTLVEDQARDAATRATQAVMNGDALGPLHGLPVVIKDVTLTKGIRTTFGSPYYKDFVPDEDAAVVTRLRDAGAIILGKTNTPEFAAGANTNNEVFGPTRNPWNAALSPAGSSGGSAVSVATFMSPLAQGTDFGCSIRIPAAFCGIVGLRTTAGLIPNYPMRLPWDPGQVHGPLTRTADDAALMLDAMTGLDPMWPISCAAPWASARDEMAKHKDAKDLRIAYVSDISGFGVDPEIDAISQKAALSLREAGAIVDHITFDCSDGFDVYKVLRGEWMAGQQMERIDLLDKFGPNLGGNVRAGLAQSVHDTALAENGREKVWARFREMFSRYDFLITPAAPVSPFPVEQNFPNEVAGRKLDNYIDWIAPAFLITLVGFPAGSVPGGLTKSGLPVGLQIVGPRFSDPRILALCKTIQSLHPIGTPPIC